MCTQLNTSYLQHRARNENEKNIELVAKTIKSPNYFYLCFEGNVGFLVRRTQTARPFRVFWSDRFVRCARKKKHRLIHHPRTGKSIVREFRKRHGENVDGQSENVS